MPINLTCNCGHPMLAAQAHAGMLARCPKCGWVMRVSTTDQAPANTPPCTRPEAATAEPG